MSVRRTSPMQALSITRRADDSFGAAASALIKSYTDKLNSVNTSGVVRQAVGMGGATGFFLMIYLLLLRPNMKNYLAPRADIAQRLDDLIDEQKWQDAIAKQKWDEVELKKQSDERARKKERRKVDKASPWLARVREAFMEAYTAVRQSEEQHLVQSGLDSLAYLRLLWLNMTCFGLISFITLPMLTIVDWNAHNKGKLWDNVVLAKVSLMDFTISGIEDETLYWHVGAAYIVTIIVCSLIYWNSLQLEKHRVDFYCNPAFLNYPSDVYKRCILIADIQPNDVVKVPSKFMKDGKEQSLLRSRVEHEVKRKIFTTSAIKDKRHEILVFQTKDPVGRQAKMTARNDLVKKLQHTLDSYLHLELKAKQVKGVKVGSVPKIHPPGQWKVKKVDALKYFRKAFQELDKNYEIDDEQVVRYAIVSFSCAGSCSVFIQHCASTTGKVRLENWELDFAPTPDGIIWRNIGLLRGVRATSYLVGYVALFLLLIIYAPPLAVVALLSNAGALTAFWPWLKRWADSQPFVFVAATTTVPPVLSAVLFSIMPWLLETVAKFQGAKTFNALQHRTIHWYLAFLVLSQLVLLPCLSTLFTLIARDMEDKPDKQSTNWLLQIWIDIVFFFAQVPSTYLSQANYWLNWLTLRWLINTIQLAQIPWLLRRLVTVTYLRMTAQDHAKEAAPAEYTLRIPNSMFSTILGLLYAPLVPFVAPVLTVGLTLQYIYHKMQAKLLFATIAETGARFWLPEMDRFLLFLLISHGCLALTCALQMADGKIALMIGPAGFAVICFRFYLRTRFNPTLLLMLHPHAKFKSPLTHDLTVADLSKGFGFLAKGVKLELGKDLDKRDREAVQKRGSELLDQYGLLSLLEKDDSWLAEQGLLKKAAMAPGTIRRREAARRKQPERKDISRSEDAPKPFT